jgi:hypothetical protein
MTANRTSLATLLLASTLLFPPLDAPANADVIADWNAKAEAIATEKRDPPLSRARNLAMVHVAMFEAMNAVAGLETPHALNLSAEGDTSVEAAAATAAHAVLVGLYPDQSADLGPALAASLAEIANGVPKVRGYALGKKAAAAILAMWRSAAAGKKDERQIGGLPTGFGP